MKSLKFALVVLSFAFVASVSSCGGKKPETTTTDSTATAAPVATPTETPAVTADTTKTAPADTTKK